MTKPIIGLAGFFKTSHSYVNQIAWPSTYIGNVLEVFLINVGIVLLIDQRITSGIS